MHRLNDIGNALHACDHQTTSALKIGEGLVRAVWQFNRRFTWHENFT
jgi:hypothetical protein